MNKWFKVVGCLFAAAVIWFVFKEQWGWFNDTSAVIVAAVACLCIWFFDKINWDVFKKEPEVYSMAEWKNIAIANLEDNCPEDINGKYYFEVEILKSVPCGIIYVSKSKNTPLHKRRCAFGSVFKDSKEVILSPLEDLDWHRRYNKCQSKSDIGRLYLRPSDVLPLSILKSEKKTKEKEVLA